jgi:hypothetical protein
MSGNDEFDECPFCGAAWGDCDHVRLLMNLEAEVAARTAPGSCVRASSDGEPDMLVKHRTGTGGALRLVVPNKVAMGSW